MAHEVIEPTIGRIVHFHGAIPTLPGQCCAAIVVGVHNSRLINVTVFDCHGNPNPRTSIKLLQPGEECSGEDHCEWMPYQVKKGFGSESGEKAAGTEVISNVPEDDVSTMDDEDEDDSEEE